MSRMFLVVILVAGITLFPYYISEFLDARDSMPKAMFEFRAPLCKHGKPHHHCKACGGYHIIVCCPNSNRFPISKKIRFFNELFADSQREYGDQLVRIKVAPPMLCDH